MEPPLSHTKFNLDVSGIMGFLGGEEAISAMESMHFYEYRKWLGWYNSPGSYTIAKHYGRLARSRLWDGIYPGPNDEPAKLLGLDGDGPQYLGIVSGTTLNNTGHVGHVFAQYCHDLEAAPSFYSSNPAFIPQRPTTPMVEDKNSSTEHMGMDRLGTNNELNPMQPINHPDPGRPTSNNTSVRTTKVMNVVIVDFEETSDEDGKGEAHLTLAKTESPLWSVAVASVPISFNIACCIVCGLYDEWFAFGVILYGILCNGIACYFIGSAKIYLKHTIPSQHSPPGNGILEYGDTLIVCRGSERAINHVVKGKFIVRYGTEGKDVTYHKIGLSAMSLTTQFVAQLFLIPLSSLFGQIMFLSTLAISWLYNAYLSSINKGQLQQQLLKRHLRLKNNANSVTKLALPTRTSAVVFALLCGFPELRGDSATNKECATEITSHLLPKGTKVWRRWQTEVASKIRELSDYDPSEPPPTAEPFCFANYDYQGLEEKDEKLLKVLFEDARGGYESYRQFLKFAPRRQMRCRSLDHDLLYCVMPGCSFVYPAVFSAY